MADLDALVRELVTLRRGKGLEGARLLSQVGPVITGWCQLHPSMKDREIRQRVRSSIERAIADFNDDDRLAIIVGLGMPSDAWHSMLHRREQVLAERLGISERTARRRVDSAFRRLAEEILADHGAEHRNDSPDSGWTVRRLRALVRLDCDAPELSEERTIIAARDDLTHITARFTVPRLDDGTDGERRIAAKANGVVIKRVQRQGQRHFHLLLTLPRTLSRGDVHTYGLTFQILDTQPIRSSYAFVPLVDCEFFDVTVRFDPRRVPSVVWRLDQVPHSLLSDPAPPGPALPLDGAYEVHQHFASLKQGYGYGLRWLADPDQPT
jgi:hypothetical protein